MVGEQTVLGGSTVVRRTNYLRATSVREETSSSAERLGEGVVHSSSSSPPSNGGEPGRGSSLSFPGVSRIEELVPTSVTQHL